MAAPYDDAVHPVFSRRDGRAWDTGARSRIPGTSVVHYARRPAEPILGAPVTWGFIFAIRSPSGRETRRPWAAGRW